MNRFAGKGAIVTGASSGIGAATALRMQQEGALVVGLDLNEPAGLVGRHITCDVSDSASVDAAIESAVGVLRDADRKLDVLVNNAGIGSFGLVETLSDDDWHRVMDVNASGVFYACRRVIPIMRENGGGSIVNVASISGLHGDYGFAAYNASKGATVNLTRALALDHGRHGIRVNAVCPGLVDTPLTEGIRSVEALVERWGSAIPLGRAAQPDEIAAAVVFLASDEASYFTGANVVADGGITAATGQPDVMATMRRD